MTATERLRQLLDERGVRHADYGSTGTFWTGGSNVEWGAEESGRHWTLFAHDLTPEQAIDAALGRGTCHDLAVTPSYRDKTEFKCSACGYEYSAVGGFGCDSGDEPEFNYCPECGRVVI